LALAGGVGVGGVGARGAFLAGAAAGDQAKSLTDLLPAMTSLAGLADVIACGSVGG